MKQRTRNTAWPASWLINNSVNLTLVGFSDVTMNIGMSHEYTYLSYEYAKASNNFLHSHPYYKIHAPLPLADLSSDRSRLPRVT